jgi:hypothetical protein
MMTTTMIECPDRTHACRDAAAFGWGKARQEVTGEDGKDITITIRKMVEPGADGIVASSPTYPHESRR